MTVHAAMRPVLIVTELRTMALRTQRHRIGHGERTAIRKVQAWRLARLMACGARQRSVTEEQPLVELLELVHVLRQRFRVA
jgi:hypothetical protein